MPEQGLGYFLSINASSPALSQVEDLIFAYITRGVAIPPKPAAVPLDAEVVAAAGFYQFASPRNEKFKFLNQLLLAGWTYTYHGKLYRRGLIPGPPEELVYLGHNQFRTAKESGADGVYCTDNDGNRYGCGELACFRKISPVWPATQLILLVGAVLTMATSIGFALVWIPRKLLGRMQGVRYLAVRVVPLLASLHLPCHHRFVDTRRRLDLRTRDSQSLCDRHLFVDAPVRNSFGSRIRAGDSFVRISDESRGAASFDSSRVRRPRLDRLSGLLGNDRLPLLGDLRFQGDDALSIS